MSHTLKMIIGCILPLLLIFLLPLFGISNEVVFLVFIILMFGCHIFMMAGHGHHQGEEEPHGKGKIHGNH